MSSLSVIDSLTLAFFSPGYTEMAVIAGIALLLFGGNLPEVARSWGKTFAEFRRSLSGIQNEINDVIYSEPEQIAYRDDAYVDQGYEEPDGYEEALDESAADTTVEGDAEEKIEEKPTE